MTTDALFALSFGVSFLFLERSDVAPFGVFHARHDASVVSCCRLRL